MTCVWIYSSSIIPHCVWNSGIFFTARFAMGFGTLTSLSLAGFPCLHV